MNKDIVCSLLWNHLYLNNEGYFLPCCSSNQEIKSLQKDSTTILKKNSLDNLHELPFVQKIRQDMLNGIKSKYCTQCYDAEDKGIVSYRQLNNELFEETFQKLLSKKLDAQSKMNFEYVDLRLGNSCNLSCRMCPAESSANLVKDLEILENKTFSSSFFENTNWYKNKDFWNELVLMSESFKKIYLAGGEPFLIKESWNFLDELIKNGKAGDITLYYSTNLTVIPKEAYSIWPKFKKVILSLSIDSTEQSYEYIRYPIKWNKVLNNLTKLDDEFLNLNIESAVVYSTIQAYNYNAVPKLYKLLKSFKNIDQYPIINILTTPSSLKLSNLPREIKLREVSELKKILFDVSTSDYKSNKWKRNFANELIRLINELSSKTQPNIEELKRYTTYFDKSRSQDIFQIIPELKNYF